MTDSPDEIAGPPAGKNMMIGAGADIPQADRMDIVFVAGEPLDTYAGVAALVLDEFPRGTRFTLSQGQAKELERWMTGKMGGHQMSLQMLCAAENCPYYKLCPIVRAKVDVPKLHPCPWEGALFKVRAAKLCDELKIDPNNTQHYIDYNIVRDLCGVELIMERVAMEIALKPKNVDKEVRGIDATTGQLIYGEEINKRYERLATLSAQKLKLLQSLSATRQERIKTGSDTGMDPGTYLSELYRKSRLEMAVEVEGKRVDTSAQPPSVEESLLNAKGMVEIEDDG